MPIVSAVVAGALKIVEIRIARVKAEMRHGGNYHCAVEQAIAAFELTWYDQ